MADILGKVVKLDQNVLSKATTEELESLVTALGVERNRIREQTLRVRSVLNQKIREQQIAARFGPHMLDMVKKLGPEEAQRILKDAANSIKEQVVKPETISTKVGVSSITSILGS